MRFKDNKYSICLSRNYDYPAKILFSLIKKGVLFKLTGADKIDFNFNESGTFKFIFNYIGQIDGVFKKIIPNEKIILIWNVNGFGKKSEVDTNVIISLQNNKNRTRLTIEHSGIKYENAAQAKERAWSEILVNIESELKKLSS